MTEHEQAILKEAEEIKRRHFEHPGSILSDSANHAAQGAAMREMTVRELLARRIVKAERHVKCLRDFHENIPASFLDSGASRIQALIEL